MSLCPNITVGLLLSECPRKAGGDARQNHLQAHRLHSAHSAWLPQAKSLSAGQEGDYQVAGIWATGDSALYVPEANLRHQSRNLATATRFSHRTDSKGLSSDAGETEGQTHQANYPGQIGGPHGKEKEKFFKTVSEDGS